MKKSILNLGKALNKKEQKEINGGREFSGTCSEWCSDSNIQEIYWKPLYCNCNSTSGGSGNSGGNNGGNDGPV